MKAQVQQPNVICGLKHTQEKKDIGSWPELKMKACCVKVAIFSPTRRANVCVMCEHCVR